VYSIARQRGCARGNLIPEPRYRVLAWFTTALCFRTCTRAHYYHLLSSFTVPELNRYYNYNIYAFSDSPPPPTRYHLTRVRSNSKQYDLRAIFLFPFLLRIRHRTWIVHVVQYILFGVRHCFRRFRVSWRGAAMTIRRITTVRRCAYTTNVYDVRLFFSAFGRYRSSSENLMFSNGRDRSNDDQLAMFQWPRHRTSSSGHGWKWAPFEIPSIRRQDFCYPFRPTVFQNTRIVNWSFFR
jgi:hypothetical protein